MTTRYEGADAANMSVQHLAPGSWIGNVILGADEHALILGYDEVFYVTGTLDELRSLHARIGAALDREGVHECDEDEPCAVCDEDEGDDGSQTVCAYCAMALDWEPGDGWVALRWIGDDANGQAIDRREPICSVPHADGNRHRALTPSEREACPACGDPEGPCDIAPCGDPGCDARDCESHETCVRPITDTEECSP